MATPSPDHVRVATEQPTASITLRPQDQATDVTLAEIVAGVRAFRRTVWRERRDVFRTLALTVPLGLIIALFSRSEYTATTQILPYRNPSNTEALSSLAGLAGIRLPTGITEETITADLYPVIAQTLDFRASVALTPIRFASSPAPETAVRYFTDHRTLLDAAGNLIGEMRQAVFPPAAPAPTSDRSMIPAGNGDSLRLYSRRFLDIIRNLNGRLLVGIDKKTSIITITGVMPDPYAAADLVQTASGQLMQRIIDYQSRKAEEQLQFVEGQYAQRRAIYEDAQRKLAEFEDRNRMLVSPVAQVERERLQRDYDVAYQVLQQYSLVLAQAEIRKNQNTPVFTVLQQPVVPDRRSSPKRTLILVLAVLAGIAAGVVRIYWRRLIPPPEGTPPLAREDAQG